MNAPSCCYHGGGRSFNPAVCSRGRGSRLPVSLRRLHRRCIDEIFNSAASELLEELASLRASLDDFEKVLVARSARTKSDMEGLVSVVGEGRGLTLYVSGHVARLRATHADLFDDQLRAVP